MLHFVTLLSPSPKEPFCFAEQFLYRKFSTALHSAAYLSRRGAKNTLLFSNTLCCFQCFHTLGYHLHIDDSLSHSVLCFDLFFPFFSLPIPTFPKTSYVRSLSSPPHIPPMAQGRAAPSPGFLQRSGTPHNCRYSHSYRSQPGCSHQEEEE